MLVELPLSGGATEIINTSEILSIKPSPDATGHSRIEVREGDCTVEFWVHEPYESLRNRLAAMGALSFAK